MAALRFIVPNGWFGHSDSCVGRCAQRRFAGLALTIYHDLAARIGETLWALTQLFDKSQGRTTLLAKHYGFTDEELDFIINYDIKYRMGKEGEE